MQLGCGPTLWFNLISTFLSLDIEVEVSPPSPKALQSLRTPEPSLGMPKPGEKSQISFLHLAQTFRSPSLCIHEEPVRFLYPNLPGGRAYRCLTTFTSRYVWILVMQRITVDP